MSRPWLWLLAALLLSGVSGCGGCGGTPPPETPPAAVPAKPVVKAPEPAPPPAVPAAPAEAAEPATITAQVLVTDYEGAPLAGMIPIVTRQPNAFDEPVARGNPTDASGVSRFTFPAGEKLCLRAWDPDLNYFPNNFFDVGPVAEVSAADTPIVMVRAAILRGLLLRPDGGPAANEEVSLMLSHPVRGPWWPAKTRTGPDGMLLLPNMPPGMFQVEIQAESGRLSLPQATLLPGIMADVGMVTLAPPGS